MAKQKRMITKQAKKLQSDINKELNQREYLRGRREIWQKYRVRNDVKALVAYCEVSRIAIGNALNKGIGSIALLTKIDDYFKPREDADTKKD